MEEIPVNETKAAEYLGLSVHWMRRARWAGGGPAYIKYRRAVLYLPSVLHEFRQARIRQSTSDD